MFHRRNYVIPVLNDMKASKWWQDFNFFWWTIPIKLTWHDINCPFCLCNLAKAYFQINLDVREKCRVVPDFIQVDFDVMFSCSLSKSIAVDSKLGYCLIFLKYNVISTGYAPGTPFKMSCSPTTGAVPPYSSSPNPYAAAVYPMRSPYPQQNLYAQVKQHKSGSYEA